MSNPITDIHLHCALKSFAADGHPDYSDSTIWDYFPAQEEAHNKLNFLLRAAIKETAKDSQANLDACAQAQLRIPFLAICPIERQMFDLDPQKPFRNFFKTLLNGQQHAYLGSAVTGFPLSNVEEIIEEVADPTDRGFNYYSEYRREAAYLTIFQIIKVVHDQRGEDAWKMIALGSDSDGMVDPLNTFPTVDSYQDLRQEMINYLEQGKTVYFAQNGEARTIPTAEVRQLQFGQQPEQLLERILHGNADGFLQKYFNEDYLGKQLATELILAEAS